ncbi:MAG: Mut7-C ubiquitin/RNAse domain-containing protein [Chloroflexaceae bacterium]|nr:Mut7-C ubiquitin/RNAse domain-containing protein [Chloroflexaceae bacterium]
MGTVVLRCYAELNDFLPRTQRNTTIAVSCAGHETVKNLVESLGVPHPEIAALLANGEPVGFGYLVRPGDRVEVYPVSTVPDTPLFPLRPPLTTFRFILDAHLGRLAAYLRMLGFDTLYRNDYDDPELARLAHDEQRILLTRDVGLLKRSLVTHGYFVRTTVPVQQIGEIVQRFNLRSLVTSFQRCIRCNGLTRPVEKAAIAHLLAAKTRQYFDRFWQCQECGQIYWRGSHYARMQQLTEQVLCQTDEISPSLPVTSDERREMCDA